MIYNKDVTLKKIMLPHSFIIYQFNDYSLDILNYQKFVIIAYKRGGG